MFRLTWRLLPARWLNAHTSMATAAYLFRCRITSNKSICQ